MAKNCPKCGKSLPNEAKFCMDCGYAFDDRKSNIFKNGKIFLVLIALVIILGGIFILTSTGSNNTTSEAVDEPSPIDLTITDVGGYDSDGSSKKSYSLYTSALFNKVPDDMKGYNVKTTYYDVNSTEIGQETESLEQIYYDTDYSITFGYYTTYKEPNPNQVSVEIIKEGKIIDTFEYKIDQSKIDFLN